MAISLTDSARDRIRGYLDADPAAIGLGFGVSRTGCSGWGYKVDMARSAAAGDTVLHPRGRLLCAQQPALRGLAAQSPSFWSDGPQLARPSCRALACQTGQHGDDGDQLRAVVVVHAASDRMDPGRLLHGDRHLAVVSAEHAACGFSVGYRRPARTVAADRDPPNRRQRGNEAQRRRRGAPFARWRVPPGKTTGRMPRNPPHGFPDRQFPKADGRQRPRDAGLPAMRVTFDGRPVCGLPAPMRLRSLPSTALRHSWLRMEHLIEVKAPGPPRPNTSAVPGRNLRNAQRPPITESRRERYRHPD